MSWQSKFEKLATNGCIGKIEGSVAIGYCRVAVLDISEEETALTRQVERIHEVARQHGYSIPRELMFVDNGYSGTSLERPELQRLLQTLSSTDAKAVVVESFERLSRKPDWQLSYLLHTIKSAGLEAVLGENESVLAHYIRSAIR